MPLSSNQLDATFSALSHPARRAILAQLATGRATVNTLAEPLKMSLPAVSRHIKILTEAGLVEQDRQAQYRYCRMNAKPLQAISSWTDHYKSIWENRLDAMEQHLMTMQGENHER